MYPIHNILYTSFILYKIGTDGQFHIFKEFSNFDSLITFFAKAEIANSSPPWRRVSKQIIHEINLTGNDTFVYTDWKPYHYGEYYGLSAYRTTTIRPYLLMDKAGRIINPHDFAKNIQQKRVELTNRKPVYHYWRKLPPYTYHYDPVPYTGVRHGHYGRKVKHWFRSYRDDRIPEYEPYVRKKAMVPNTWDSEPFEPRYKSWKHNSKKRHQWE